MKAPVVFGVAVLAAALLAALPAANAASAAAHSAIEQATELVGKVTAKKADGLLVVDFEPHPSAEPAVGDQVVFTTMLSGFPAAGGRGEVVEVGSDFVVVRPTEDNPGLQYDATIAATGRPPAAPTGSAGGDAGLVTDGVAGYFEMLLPANYHLHVHEESGATWEVDSLWAYHGFAAETPAGDRPPWNAIELSGIGTELAGPLGRPISIEEAVRIGHVGWASLEGTSRFPLLRVSGETQCAGFSVDEPDYMRHWVWWCERGGRYYSISFLKEIDEALAGDDETVERMVRSFKPMR